jgi:hypothetical protein
VSETRTLRTPIMRRLLARCLREARKPGVKIPRQGMVLTLFEYTDRRKWDYQIDLVNDKRQDKEPFVVVHAFKPWPHAPQDARTADFKVTGYVKP